VPKARVLSLHQRGQSARGTARALCALLAAIFMVGAIHSRALAETLTWTGAGNGVDFNLAANWSPVKKPSVFDDCIVPSGPGQLEFSDQSASVRSLTLGRPLLIQKCFSIALVTRLTLAGGSITIDDTAACAAISFSTGSPIIDGAGEIIVVNAGSYGSILDLAGAAQLTIGSDVTVRIGAGSTGLTASMSMANGSKIVNLGTISQERSGGTLQIRGNGNFSNAGLIAVSAGTVDIQSSSWTNDGLIALSGGVCSVTGTYSTIGVVRNPGGTFKLRGTYTGPDLVADSDVGSLTLDGITLLGTTLRGNGRFYTAGNVTLSGCSLGTDLIVDGCSTLTISQGLTLVAGAMLECNRTSDCSSSQIRLVSGTQSVSGLGTLNGPLILSGGVQATLGPDITLKTTLTASNVGITIAPDSSLLNLGSIVVDSLGNYQITGGGDFVNAGTLSFIGAQRAKINTTQWMNLGLIELVESELEFAGDFVNEGVVWSDNSSIDSYGGSWTNHYSMVLNATVVDMQHVSVLNSGTLDLSNASFHINSSSSSQWINTGSVFMNASQLDIDGQYESIGDIVRVGGKLTLSGTHTGPLLAATAATGDVALWNVELTNARLQGTGGARFIVEKKPTLTACVLASDVTVTGACASIEALAGLTLENASVSLYNTPCDSPALVFVGAQTLAGAGSIQLDGVYSLGGAGAAQVTIAPGVTLKYGPVASAGTSFLDLDTACQVINQGTVSVQRAGGRLQVLTPGTFDNQSLISVGPGEFLIGSLSGSLGDIAFTPPGIVTVSAGSFVVNKPITIPSGATLSLNGTYSINQPISVQPGGKLTLLGTWTNNSSVSASNATVTLGGTWANAGSISVTSSALTFSGLPADLGDFTNSGNTLTYTGTYKLPSLVADAGTGDITLGNITMTGTTLTSRDGAKFIFSGLASPIFSGCAFDGDIVFGPCVSPRFRNGVTLLNGTDLILANTTCGNGFTFDSNAQSITGSGAIVLRSGSASPAMSVASFPSLTIDSGISLRVDADATFTSSPSISSPAAFINRGKVLMAKSGRSLVFSSGSFTNEGIVQATAGTISFGRVNNVVGGTTGVLTGGIWRADGGAIVLGNRITGIAAGTEFLVNSPPPAPLTDFRNLAFNAGTFSIRNCTVSVSSPGVSGFTNQGSLSVESGGLLAVTGPVTLDPSGSLSVSLAGTATSQFGRITATGAFTLDGPLSAAFSAPYVPALGDSFSPVLRASSFTGSFSSVCAQDNPQSLGIASQVLPIDASTFALSLYVSDTAGIQPSISQQPEEADARPDAHFHVVALPAAAQFQWRHNGAPLTDGPTGSGSEIAGALTAQLTIVNAAPSDAGDYDVIVSTPCNTITSQSAPLHVCPADFNNDDLVDDADFLIFVSAYSLLDCADPEMPAGCPADLDRDQFVNDADFQLFLPAYNALLCP